MEAAKHPGAQTRKSHVGSSARPLLKANHVDSPDSEGEEIDST